MKSLKISPRLSAFSWIDCCYGYTLIMQMSAAKADARTFRIDCSDYVIATKIQFPVVVRVKDRLISRNLRYLPFPIGHHSVVGLL